MPPTSGRPFWREEPKRLCPPGSRVTGTRLRQFPYPPVAGGLPEPRRRVDFQTFQDPVTQRLDYTDASVCTSATRTQAGARVKTNTGCRSRERRHRRGLSPREDVRGAGGNADITARSWRSRRRRRRGTPGLYSTRAGERTWPPKGDGDAARRTLCPHGRRILRVHPRRDDRSRPGYHPPRPPPRPPPPPGRFAMRPGEPTFPLPHAR